MAEKVIKEGVPVQIVKAGNVVEVKYLKHRNQGTNIKRLDKDHFVVVSTGEIKEFSHVAKSRMDNVARLKQTFSELRWRINANFSGSKSEVWLTLTYAENMKDHKQVSKDFNHFIKRLNGFMFGQRSKRQLEYIAIPEMQARGAWHLHVLLKRVDGDPFYVLNDKIAELWGHGFIKVHRINEADNLGLYLSSYLTDLPLEEAKALNLPIDEAAIKEVDVSGKKKAYVKGLRMLLYPAGMRYFRASQGLKKPDKYMGVNKDLGIEPRYSRSYEYEIDEFKNEVGIEAYNLSDLTKK